MGLTFYQIEIIVSGGPIGYHYTDSYETNICSSISEVTDQAYHLNLDIKKDSYERSRKFYLITYSKGNKEIKILDKLYQK